ncbi:MAG: hypothetical protein ACK4L7_12400, partial [Flavobacteriales bacterium]
MKSHMRPLLIMLPTALLACASPSAPPPAAAPADAITGWDSSLIQPGERHFKRIKQLTFGGDNAEAYWSFDGKRLVFQSTNPAWGE